MTHKKNLIELLKAHSYKELASGAESRFYVDTKATLLRPNGLLAAAGALGDAMQDLGWRPKAVAGTGLGGGLLVAAMSLITDVPGLYVRPESRGHGTGRVVEGVGGVDPGALVVVVEDVVTTGGSALRASRALREAGFDVLGVLALVDREEGARAAFLADRLAFHAVVRHNELTERQYHT